MKRRRLVKSRTPLTRTGTARLGMAGIGVQQTTADRSGRRACLGTGKSSETAADARTKSRPGGKKCERTITRPSRESADEARQRALAQATAAGAASVEVDEFVLRLNAQVPGESIDRRAR